jgi:hypothetical protein
VTFARVTTVAAFFLAAFTCCAHVASADPPEATLGITLDPILGGIHDSFNDQVHLPPIPVPLLEGSYTFSNFEITAYGLPPTIAIPYNDAIQGQVSLRLTIFDGTFRVWDAKHRFAAGVGETIYNQTTHYARADSFATSGGERQYSRIAGGHYEVVFGMPFRTGRVETSVSYAPALLGTQVSTYEDGTQSRFDPERGEQIEGNIRYVRHMSRHADFLLGVRYVNFTAAYDVPSHPLSDRNAAVLPAVGYLWRL